MDDMYRWNEDEGYWEIKEGGPDEPWHQSAALSGMNEAEGREFLSPVIAAGYGEIVEDE